MNSVARAMDANANRAREAFRVLEDAARFVLDDAALSARFKALRHDLQAALAVLPSGWLLAHRNAAEDVGTTITGSQELLRATHSDVVTAAGKRVGEALRSLEECMKTIDPQAAQKIERLRYQTYDAERDLLLKIGSGARRQWRVALLLTERLCALPWQETLAAALASGADCIQIREKEMSAQQLCSRIRAVMEVAQPFAASVIVNDRADIAVVCGAHGVHVGQDDLSVAGVRRIAGTSLLVGVSTHSMVEARAAVESGADICGVGAMFASDLKRQISPSGPGYLQEFVKQFPRVPHLAIGGITPENIGALVDAGARGVAVSSVVCGSQHPGAVVSQLRKAMDGAGN